jgi:hypothetical protein
MKNKEFNIHEYTINKAEKYQKRYIEAEKFICKLYAMPWYKKILFIFHMDRDILNFIKSRNKFDK